MKAEFIQKFKINDNKTSILLQSINVKIPEMELSQIKTKENSINYETSSKSVQINLLKLNTQFQKLFTGMKLGLLNNIHNLY